MKFINLPIVPFLTFTILGCEPPTEPMVGSTLSFDGLSQFAEVPDDSVLDLKSTWTIEAWIRPTDLNRTGFQHLISKWNGGGNASYTLELESGRLRTGIHDGVNPTQVVTSNAILQENVWQHVAVTLSRAKLRIYVNGVLDRTFDGSQTPMNSDRPLSFGHEGPDFNAWYYEGLLDDVRIWSVERIASELVENMNVRLTGSEVGLVGYWPFDDGNGDVAQDATPNGNDARLGASVGPDSSDPLWVVR